MVRIAVVAPERELSACAVEAVGYKAQRPAYVDARGRWHRCPFATRSLATAPPFHGQPSVAVDPIELLVVHAHDLALQQDANPVIAEPAQLAGDLLNLLADICAVRRAFSPR